MGGALAAWSLAGWRVRLNYVSPTDDALPYVYVQTFNDVRKIVDPMLGARGARSHGVRETPRRHPLRQHVPAALAAGRFSHIGYYADDNSPAGPTHADFLLVIEPRVADVEKRLDADYFKEVVHLRPALDALTLYLRASRFQPVSSRAGSRNSSIGASGGGRARAADRSGDRHQRTRLPTSETSSPPLRHPSRPAAPWAPRAEPQPFIDPSMAVVDQRADGRRRRHRAA